MSYASLDEHKIWNSQGTADTTDNIPLLIAGSAVKGLIDRYCDRTFDAAATATSARYYVADDSYTCRVDDIGDLTGLTISVDLDFDGTYETAWTTGDYQVQPINNITLGRPVFSIMARQARGKYFPIVGSEALVKVEACWGWPATPPDVKQAELIQVGRIHSRRRAPLGSIQAPELGGGERLLERLDPDVQVLIQKYRRSWNGLVV